MVRKALSYLLVIVITLVLAEAFHPLGLLSSLAQGGCQTFPETGKTVCGKFLTYWQQHGGLAQQGYPISGEFTEVSDLNGKPYTVQYFERAVFEQHPENQPPNDVLLSQLGTFQFQRKYPNGDPSAGGVVPTPTAVPQQPASIVGQVIEYSSGFGQGKLRATVTDVTETNNIPEGSYPAITAKGKFVIVFLTVTNIGNASTELASGVKLKDGKGRTFDQADVYAERNASDEYHIQVPYETIQPGITDKTLVVFDVAPDAANYVLVAGD